VKGLTDLCNGLLCNSSLTTLRFGMCVCVIQCPPLLSLIIHHTSYIIHHTSYIIHHTSHIIHHSSNWLNFLSLCPYVCVCVHGVMCVWMCARALICALHCYVMHTYVYVCMCIYVCVCICVGANWCGDNGMLAIARLLTSKHTKAKSKKHTHTHKHTHINTHTKTKPTSPTKHTGKVTQHTQEPMSPMSPPLSPLSSPQSSPPNSPRTNSILSPVSTPPTSPKNVNISINTNTYTHTHTPKHVHIHHNVPMLSANPYGYNITLQVLDLFCNNLTDAGIKTLARALQHNTSLMSLDLSWNAFGSKGYNYYCFLKK